MNNSEKQAALAEILELIQAGNKMQAIKKFQNTFRCGLKEAKEAVEALGSGGSNHRDYEQKYDMSFASKHQKTDKGRAARFSLPWILLTVLLFPPLLMFLYPLTIPTLRFQTVAIELKNGEIFEVPFALGRIGAVTKRGEYLIEYDAKTLAGFAASYLAPYYDIRKSGRITSPKDGWEISSNNNPWFDGMIRDSTDLLNAYYKSERVHNSPTSYHYVNTLYDQSGTAVWSHDTREKLRGSYMQRTSIGFSRRGSSGGDNFFLAFFDFVFPNCINIHQFLAEKYGIDVEMVYDKKNKMVIFKIPQNAVAL